ncbi:hypothetical protein PIB30_069268 [Stylosanthes scabra]|uniref:Uncharacterized protein n=1 Tax=Stylosanthes scabra TaxID=79078 RepID=A0ABU6UQM0_9FABA|nr:hypothetical protein [Stylosanthes scabra]
MFPTKKLTKKSIRSIGKVAESAHNGDGSSNDSHDFIEDSLYKSVREESSTNDEVDCPISQPRKRCAKKKHESGSNMNKMKENILVENASLVTQDYDEEMDWTAVLGKNHASGPSYDSYDSFPDNSDENDS